MNCSLRLAGVAVLATWMAWPATTSAQTVTDVFNKGWAGLLKITECAGMAAYFQTDFDNDGKDDTLVLVTTIKGQGGLTKDSKTIGNNLYALSYAPCNTKPTAPEYKANPGQFSIQFVDMTGAGFNLNDPKTWVNLKKRIPAVSIDASNEEGLICPRNANPYLRVQAYRNLLQQGEIMKRSDAMSPPKRNEFADSEGIKELYIHTDFCENHLDNLFLMKTTKPYITQEPPNLIRRSWREGVQLSAAAQGTGLIKYQWYKNGVPLKNTIPNPTRRIIVYQDGRCVILPVDNAISGATTSKLSIGPQLRQGDSGKYSMTATNSAGSVTTITTDLRVIGPTPCWI